MLRLHVCDGPRFWWIHILTQNSVFKIFREGILPDYLKWTSGTDLVYISEHFSECIFQKVNSVELLEFFHLVVSNYSVYVWTTRTWEVKKKENPA